MAEIKDIADELVVHADAIFELGCSKSRIFELSADFGLKSADDIFESFLIDTVPHSQDVEAATRILDESAGEDEHLDLAGPADFRTEFFLVDGLAGDEEIVECSEIGEIFVQKPARDSFFLSATLGLESFVKRFFVEEADRREEREFGLGRVRFDTAMFGHIFVLETDVLVHEK